MSAVTTALTDTWRGLVQRRLWPVALLLLVAVIAIPVALRAQPEPAPSPSAGNVAARSAELAAQPIVTAASSSERENVRRVLGARKDPFRPSNQPKKKTARKAAEDGKEPTAGGAREPATPSGAGGSVPAGTVTPNTGSGAAAEAAKPRPAAYSLTVRWGSTDADELERSNVKRLHALPDADEPVVIYLGLRRDDPKTAVFMVDAKATAEGDGRCQPDPVNCETIELREGETEFFDVEGTSGRVQQYQLDLVKIHPGNKSGANAARKAAAAVAKADRRALRSLASRSTLYRFDASSGLLVRTGDDA